MSELQGSIYRWLLVPDPLLSAFHAVFTFMKIYLKRKVYRASETVRLFSGKQSKGPLIFERSRTAVVWGAMDNCISVKYAKPEHTRTSQISFALTGLVALAND